MFDRLSDLFEVLMILFAVSQCFGQKFSKDFLQWKNVLFLTGYLCAWQALEIAGYPSAGLVLLYVYLYLFVLVKYREGCMKTVFCLVISSLFATLLQMICSIPASLLFSTSKFHFLSINFSAFWCMLLMARLINLHSFISVVFSKKKIVTAICCIYIIIMAYVFWFFIRDGGIWASGLVPAIFFCVIICFVLHDWVILKDEIAERENKLTLYDQYNDKFLELQGDLRRRQHDYDNQISAINAVWYYDDVSQEIIEQQKEHVNKISYENRFNKLISSGECPVITAFIYQKLIEAEEHGIQIQYKYVVENLICKWSIDELVILLGNLFDNAVEAALDCSEKQIYFGMWEYQKKIKIELWNSCNRELKQEQIQRFFQQGYSTKGKNRGFGLSNLKNIVNKHNDMIAVTGENRKGVTGLKFLVLIED